MEKPKTENEWALVCLWMRILREGSKPALLEAIKAYELAEAQIQGVWPRKEG